jgi:hypothetical protein
MKFAVFALGVLFVSVSGAAQMRSSVSAGPVRIGRPHPPGILSRRDFGHQFHGNPFGTVIYPYGLYDGFFNSGYPEVVEQPTPPVVVIRDAPAANAPAPQIQVAPAEPRMIEISQSRTVFSSGTQTPPAIFVLSDGGRLESQNYTITDTVLTIKEPRRPAIQVPLNQVDINSTLTENRQRGLNLHFPESRGEILIGF